MLWVGVDSDETGYLAIDSGLFLGLPDGALGQALADVHRPAWNGPVVVVGTVNHQDFPGVVHGDDVCRGDHAVRGRRRGVVVVVDPAGHHASEVTGRAKLQTRSKLSR